MTGNTLTAAAKFVDTCTSFHWIVKSGGMMLYIAVVLFVLSLLAYNIATIDWDRRQSTTVGITMRILRVIGAVAAVIAVLVGVLGMLWFLGKLAYLFVW